MSNSANTKRIAKNTGILYLRTLVTMFVSLFTSRIILETLGIADFGVYNVVGGFVAMFSIISGSLSASISRFLTFELGKENTDKLSIIFSSSLFIQIAISLFVVVLAEIVGSWFIVNKMNIEVIRVNSAMWVLHFSVATFVVNLISVPYNALIIAHERMSAFAYIGLLEVFLKLGVAFLLFLIPFDKLPVYAALLFIVSVIIRFVYAHYCNKHFKESHIQFNLDLSVLRRIFAFAGWNFIGASSAVLKDQGVNIALNIFCGPVVNAARAVTMQINAAVVGFVYNFLTAINPQITKAYAAGNNVYMQKLLIQGSKYSYYLLLLFSLPVILEIDAILSLWLTEVPAYTIIFVRLVLVYSMIECLSGPLITAMLASGRIRNYQIVVGGIQMLNFPVSYAALSIGLAPLYTFVIAIVLSVCCLFARLFMLNNIIDFSPKLYMKNVLLKIVSVSFLSFIFPLCIYMFIVNPYIRFVLVVLSSIFSVISTVLLIGMTKQEKDIVINRLFILKHKIIAMYGKYE